MKDKTIVGICFFVIGSLFGLAISLLVDFGLR